MPVRNPIAERIRLLRSRAERYKLLAEVHHDRRTAAQVAGLADELQAEVTRLERRQSFEQGCAHAHG